jgi:acyl dehydratase
MLVDHAQGRLAGMGSPGCEDIRWLQPVRPGDILQFRSECIEKTPSRSKPDRGIAKFKVTVLNQRDEPVMTVTTIGMYPRRPA